jgi:YaiO family outer membrane protein
MKARHVAAAALAAWPFAASAQDNPNPWEVRAEAQRDNLTNGQPDWTEEMLQLAWKPRRGLTALGGARWTERFDQRDREAFAAAYLPVASSTGIHLEGSTSDTHHVLARDSLLAELSQQLGYGWVASLAGKRAHYDTGDVDVAIGTVEKYWTDWRFAYTGYLSRAESGGWAPTHRLSATWYRGDLTYASASVASGRDVENVFPAGLVTTSVRAATLGGGYEIARWLGLTLDLGYVRQGDLYTRRYVRLGARILF